MEILIRMRILIIIIFYFLCSAKCYGKVFTKPLPNYITNAQVLEKDFNNTLLIGAENGLFSFNGIEFNTELLGVNITAIGVHKNASYIGTYNGKLYKNKSLINSINLNAPISQIICLNDSVIIATKGQGLFCYFKDTLFTIYKNELPDLFINKVIINKNKIFVSTDRGVLIVENNNEFILLNSKSGLTDNLVLDLALLNDTLHLLTESKGIFSYDSNYTLLKNDKLSNPIKTLLQPNNTINLFSNGNLTLLDESKLPVTFKSINTFYVEADGDIWLIGKDSIYNINQAAIVKKMEPAVGAKYVNNKLITITNKQTIKIEGVEYLLPFNNKATYITAIENIEDDILVGTFGEGIFIKQKMSNKFAPLYKIAPKNITHINVLPQEIIIASLEGFFTYQINWQTLENSLINMPDLPNKFIYDALKYNNEYWLATDGSGTIQIKNNKIFKVLNGLQDKVIYSLKLLNNTLYALGASGNIYKYANGWELFQKATTGLKYGATLFSNNKNIYVLHNNGIQQVQTANCAKTMFELTGQYNAIDYTNPFSISFNNNNFALINNGMVSEINYQYIKNKQPNTYISQIKTGSKIYNDSFPSQINFANNSVFIKLNTNYYLDLQDLQYKYQLNKSGWLHTKDNSITFLNLPSGKYQVAIIPVLNGIEYANLQVNYQFQILSPIYKRWWFLALMGVAILSLIYLFLKWRVFNQNKLKQIENENLNYKLQVLNSQISPHFLFNSFNTLISIIDLDKEDASIYTQQLSDYFRLITQNQSNNLISLEEELNLLEHYYYIQFKRFGHTIKLNINDNIKQNLQTKIPPFTLQLLLENAIKHNAMSLNNPLVFNLNIQDQYLLVSNNVQKKGVILPSLHVGLKNIQQRYLALLQLPIVIINDQQNFIIKLPLVK